jgi:hypothetical protein
MRCRPYLISRYTGLKVGSEFRRAVDTTAGVGKTKGHLLPFCSHAILKHPQKRGTYGYQERISNCSLFRTFSARSEGYRRALKTTHNPEVVGSNPAPATIKPNTSPVLRRPSGLGWTNSRALLLKPSSGNLR